MSKHTRTTPPETSVPHPTTDWITRATDAIKRRDQNEAEIAAALREGLDLLGKPKWLEECERTWGWARSTAYNHLNPKLLAKDRARTQAAAMSRDLDVIARELQAMGLKKPEPGSSWCNVCKAIARPTCLSAHPDHCPGPKIEMDTEPATITCSYCTETYPKRDFTKHVMKCPGPTVKPERDLTDAEILESDQAVADKWSEDEEEAYRFTLRVKDAVRGIRNAVSELRHLEGCKASFTRSQIEHIRAAHRSLGEMSAVKTGRL
jgi:hypothetical protein